MFPRSTASYVHLRPPLQPIEFSPHSGPNSSIPYTQKGLFVYRPTSANWISACQPLFLAHFRRSLQRSFIVHGLSTSTSAYRPLRHSTSAEHTTSSMSASLSKLNCQHLCTSALPSLLLLAHPSRLLSPKALFPSCIMLKIWAMPAQS